MEKNSPSGLILFNKKAGVTSFKALNEIKHALGTSKAGHTGTLDKFAQGLLVVLAGKALKLSRWFSHLDKKYIGTIRFGIETDTLDPEGNETANAPLPAKEKIEQVLPFFTGNILQEPPAYSAIHVNGKRACALARGGKTPEMKKRPVSVYKLELRSWQPPYAEIFAHCSGGTYIRSLARDIALAAGSRAHLCSLVRTNVADFSVEDAWDGTEDIERNFLRPIDKTIISSLHLGWFDLPPNEAENIFQGKPLSNLLEGKPLISQCGKTAASEASSEASPDFEAAVFSCENLIAIVNKSNNMWKYNCVLTPSA